MRGKIRHALVFASVSMALACGALHAQTETRSRFDLPPQALGDALRTLGSRTNTNVMFDPMLVARLQAPALKGELTLDQALGRLLVGTGLRYEFLNDKTVVLAAKSPSTEDASSAPASDSSDQRESASSRVRGDNERKQTHNQTLPGGLRVEQAAGRAAAGTSADDRGNQDTRIALEELVVTGSRLQRHGDTGASPIIAISRDEIDRSGAATMREVLNTLTQNAVSPDESGNAAFLGASTIQLRGLPVGTTLLLLNGRRLGASGPQVAANFFDLNNIPLEAVERIEILTDSASAIYGADAIGGAVNVILRTDFEGAGASVRYGTSAESDASERNASLAIGGETSAWSGMLVLDYFARDPLRGTDRELTSTQDFTRFGGADFRSTFAYPANVYSLDGGPLPGLTGRFAGVPSGTDGVGLTAADFASTDGVLNMFDGAAYTTLLAEAERKSAFATGRYTAPSGLQVFGEVLHTDRTQIVQFAPDALPFGNFGLFTVPATNPFNPFGVPVGVDYRLVDFGPRTQVMSTDFSRAVIGAQGRSFERFDWEVYVLADEDESEVFNRGYVNASLNMDLVQQYLDSTDPNVALNVFSTTGNNNPDTIAAILGQTQVTDDLSTRATMAEAVIRGPLADLPAGPLRAAFGVNARREKVAFLSSLAGDLRDERESAAAFMELSMPLVSAAQNVRAIHSLELSAAVRHDHYSGLDSSTNPQFGLTWRPVANLLLRGSYGEAFKAPTVFDLFFPPLSIMNSALDPSRGNEPAGFVMTLGGNPDLAPETGRSVTLGLVWEPEFARGLTATLNTFRLEQEDFITSLNDVNLLLANEHLFPGRVVRAAPDATDPPGFAGRILSVDATFLNFGKLTVKGADLRLEYVFPATAIGDFSSTVGGTYTDEYEILVTPGTEPINQVNHANEAGYPVRFKGMAGLDWRGHRGWSAGITARYLNSYLDYDGLRELPSQTLIDARVGYSFSPAAFLSAFDGTLGIINVTDEQGSFSNNPSGYDSRQADIRGRFYYVSLKARF